MKALFLTVAFFVLPLFVIVFTSVQFQTLPTVTEEKVETTHEHEQKIQVFYEPTDTSKKQLKTQDRTNNGDVGALYFSAVLAIAKNESMVIDEFIAHHLTQVDHIFLIDNGSTDDTLQKLSPWIEQGNVTVFFYPQQHAQIEHYNHVYNLIRDQVTWLAVIDVDEYLFCPAQPLKHWLKTTENQFEYYNIRWSMFGTSGHITQPSSIRKSLVWRQDSNEFEGKGFFKTNCVQSLLIHGHHTKPGTVKEIVHIRDPRMRLHHYQNMSQEYYEKVKLKRGDAHLTDNPRNIQKFHEHNKLCTVFDPTLARLPYLTPADYSNKPELSVKQT